MFKAGVVDPAKVTRSALQNAASIAALFLTTEAVVAEKPEKEKAAPPCPAAATWTSSSRASTQHRNGGRTPRSAFGPGSARPVPFPAWQPRSRSRSAGATWTRTAT